MEYWNDSNVYYAKTNQEVINFIDLTNVDKKGSQFNWKTLNNVPLNFKYQETQGTLYASFKNSDSRVPLITLTFKGNETTLQVTNLKRVKLNYLINLEKKYTFDTFDVGDTYKGCEVLSKRKVNNKTYYLVYNTSEEVYGTISNQKFLTLKTNNYVPYNTVPQSITLYKKKHIHRYIKHREDLFNYRYTSIKKVLTKCPNCGREKYIRVNDLIKDNYICQCSKQYSSFGERLTQSYLDTAGIKYTREHMFRDLGRKRFDFYLPEYNTVLEVHGIQHYQEVTGYMNHKKTVASDTVKKNYCKEHNIHYIEIDARKSTFKHILRNLDKVFKNYKVDKDNVVKRYRGVYR